MAFSGLIAEIPIGIDGLTGNRNQSQVSPAQIIVANNLTYEDGTLRKEGGASKYNSTAISGTPKVIGGWDWFPAAAVQRMIVVTDDGKILRDTGAGDFTTTLKSGLTLSDVIPVFVEGGKEAAANNRKLFIFTEKNAVQVLSGDGLTTSDITTPPADWSGANQPSFGLTHEDRHWGGGNSNDRHRLYFSRVIDHEDFTGAGSGTLSIFPGEGEGLVGAISFKGLIIAWKEPRGMYLVDTSDADTTLWRVTRLSGDLGGAGPRSFAAIDDDVVFMDGSYNLHLVSSVTAFGNLGTRNLSDIADLGPLLRSEFNLSQTKEARAIFYVAKREVHFSVASTGSTINNRRLVIDFNRTDLPRFRISDRDVTTSIWLKKDTNGTLRPTIGDDAGFVWNLDQDTRNKDGLGYKGEFQSGHLDLSHLDPKLGTVRKNGRFLELVVEPKGNFDLNVDIIWDDEVQETVTFNMGSPGVALGTFVLGTDKLAGSNVLNKKRRITGSGRRISLAGRNSGADEDFSLARFFLHFTPSNERL